MVWKINIADQTATSGSGLVVKFTPAPDTPGAWDGEVEHPIPASAPRNAAVLSKMMREAGEVFMAELKKAKP